jgi:hypothetical protein
VTTRIARTLAEIEVLRELWEATPTSRDSDIDFYHMVLGAHSESVRPHVIVLENEGKREAILVGRLDNRVLSFNIGYFRAFRFRVRCVTILYGAVHGKSSPETIKALLQEVMASLRRGEADVASFEFVPVESELYRLATTVPGLMARDSWPAKQGHEIVTLSEDVEDIFNRMSRARRKHTKSRMKKLQKHPEGPARIVCYQDESELNRLFADAERVACKTYQRGLNAGFADRSDIRMRLQLAARKKWLRGFVLYLGDRPIAFWIGTIYGDTFLGEYTGYDPEFAQISPGTYLMFVVLERFCKRINGDNVKQVDFGLGAADYKAAISSTSWQEAKIFIFSPTLKGMRLKGAKTLARLIDGTARNLLAGARVMPRLKRMWRDRLAPDASPRLASRT